MPTVDLIGFGDADAFYASAEAVRRPWLAPLAVGVLGNQGACVIARNYKMKAYGVKVGDPIWKAKVKCPSGVYLKRDFKWYETLSRRMLAEITNFSPAVEYFSIDEFFWDGIPAAKNDYQKTAEAVRGHIKETVGVPMTVAFARTRTLAKLFADTAKPFGAVAVRDEDHETAMLAKLPVADLFALPEPPPELTPRYNIAPSQPVPVVGLKPDGVTRGLALLKWGFVPSWSDDPDRSIRPSNARADSLGKPMFRTAFERQRCLIVADGFYEWKTEGRKKLPYHFRMADDRPFAFAGLWSFWTDGSRKLTRCCMVTTDPNDVVAPFHNRMPVILPPDAYAAWLNADTPVGTLRQLLRPYTAGEMVAMAVSPRVNKPEFDGPELLQPAA